MHDWTKIKAELDAVPIDPISMSSDQVQQAIDAASKKLAELLAKKCFELMGIPKDLCLPQGPYSYVSAKNAATTTASSAGTAVLNYDTVVLNYHDASRMMRRVYEEFDIFQVLPDWITQNRRRLAEDLWLAGEAFRRSIAAWGAYYRPRRREAAAP